MSWQACAWAIGQKTGSPARKIVLILLANRADEEGKNVFISQSRIAREGEMSTKSVRAHLKALEDMGIIRRDERRREDGSRSTDLIELNMSGEISQGENISPPTENISSGGDESSGGVGKNRALGGENISGLEPSINLNSNRNNNSAGAKKGSRLKSGTPLSQEFIEEARRVCPDWTDVEIADCWEEFVDYWCAVSGKAGIKVDWLATWRNRLKSPLNIVNQQRRMNSRGKSAKPSRHAGFDQLNYEEGVSEDGKF